ncbi:MAG: MATE family efflux transporter [Deltaproteobacteria bacterium]|jgi:MATE family multidrug resistance protein|nr:MATE family efflux transporter [Deltaproteobacteria bacterium]
MFDLINTKKNGQSLSGDTYARTPARTSERSAFFKVAVATAPFMISSGAYTFKLTADRLMLAQHSPMTMSAAISSGLCAFMLASIFIGAVGYASVLVSQFHGAGQDRRIGPCVWQSLLMSLGAGLIIMVSGRITAPLFWVFGHAPELAAGEIIYFQTLTAGAVFSLLSTSLMCFWTGRQKTWVVVVVNLFSITCNVGLNRVLIFGLESVGIPAMGIGGAALANVASDALKALILLIMFTSKTNQKLYDSRPGKIVDLRILSKHIIHGLDCGLQALISVGSLACFNVLMGCYALTALHGNVAAASAMAFTLNAALSIPMIAMGSAVAMLTGYGAGAGNETAVRRVVAGAIVWTLAYTSIAVTLVALNSERLLSLFTNAGGMDEATRRLASSLMGFSAVYFAIESWSHVFGGVIRGAGDTGFSMRVSMTTGLGVMVGSLVVFHCGGPATTLWGLFVASAAIRSAALIHRYLGGRWQGKAALNQGGSLRSKSFAEPWPVKEEGILV